MDVISRKRASIAGLSRYFTGNPCKHGHIAERYTTNCVCAVCAINISRKWQKNNPDRYAAYKKAFDREYARNNPEKVRANRKRWALRNPEKWDSIRRDYWAKTSAYWSQKYRCRKNDRTPKWLTDDHWAEIKFYYDAAKNLTDLCEDRYSVDHIHALNGENFSGLHVPWNLQVITLSSNSKKNNAAPDEIAEITSEDL